MSCTSSEAAPARAAALLAALWLGACTHLPPPAHPRPALPAAPAGAAAAALAAPELVHLTPTGPGRWQGHLRGAGEVVEFTLWRTPGTGPQPLVLLVPILAGGADLLEAVARRVAAHGFDVAFCGRAGSALQPPQRGRDLQELFRRTLLQQRLLLAWLAGPDQPPAAGRFVLGMSMGGIVATVLAAEEPSLDGLALCLAGGDLAGLVGHSGEPRVQRWVAWRATADGVAGGELTAELRTWLTLEPLRHAARVPAEKVLFVSARFDDVVPRPHQDLLWEALGRPARYDVPLGHYSAALAMDGILDAAARHFRARAGAAAAAAAAPARGPGPRGPGGS